MKLLLLADATAVHTKRWVEALSERSIEIFLVSITMPDDALYEKIKYYSFNMDRNITNTDNNDLSKLLYFRFVRKIRSILKEFKPDLLHAHYATSYGLLGSLTGFHPYLISVWGTDVFRFPRKSIFHKLLLMYNLGHADKILSTSYAMARESSNYTHKRIEITPFGVDLEKFRNHRTRNFQQKETIVFGTVKTLDPFYGIDTLIRAFHLVINVLRDESIILNLRIVGDGPQFDELVRLADELKISDKVIFKGRVSPNEVASQLNELDIFVALSNFESFGVSVIEASACELPVIVSDVGGLPEVVEDGISGLIVPNNNPEMASEAMLTLIRDKDLRINMGRNGRERVMKLFDWVENVNTMLSVYNSI